MICFLLISLGLNIQSSRRAMIATFALTSSPTSVHSKEYIDNDIDDIDHMSHWSFFVLAPPPIADVLSYEELVDFAKNGHVQAIQPAVQHDVLIATSNKGWRYASFIKDKDTKLFVLDCMTNKSIPFAILPRDPIRNMIHDVAQLTFDTFLIMIVLEQWNLLPFNITSFGKLKDYNDTDV